METITGALFVGTVVIAVTEFIKHLNPNVKGALTIAIAAAVGLVVALVDVQIGVENLSVAQGILTGLSAAGIVAVAQKI